MRSGKPRSPLLKRHQKPLMAGIRGLSERVKLLLLLIQFLCVCQLAKWCDLCSDVHQWLVLSKPPSACATAVRPLEYSQPESEESYRILCRGIRRLQVKQNCLEIVTGACSRKLAAPSVSALRCIQVLLGSKYCTPVDLLNGRSKRTYSGN